MNRRDLLKKGVYGLAGVSLSSTLMSTLQSCSSIEKYIQLYFSNNEFSLLSNIVDFLVPKTETPGAVEMKVPQFIDIIISETYNNESKNNFSNKFKILIEDFKSNNGRFFDEYLKYKAHVTRQVYVSDSVVIALKLDEFEQKWPEYTNRSHMINSPSYLQSTPYNFCDFRSGTAGTAMNEIDAEGEKWLQQHLSHDVELLQ